MITGKWDRTIRFLQNALPRLSLPLGYKPHLQKTRRSRPLATMEAWDQIRTLQIRCWWKKKQRWRHTSNGRNVPPQTGQAIRGDNDTGSSGSSAPPSPTSPVASSSSPATSALPSSIQVLTWNIDFMQPNGYTRTITALDHIQRVVFDCGDGRQPVPCVLLFQEIHPESLPAILEHAWVREHFLVVPTKTDAWPNPAYGNVTLVARTIPVHASQILVFGSSMMGRHALLVDLRLSARTERSDDKNNEGASSPVPAREVILRVANVHLESLPYGALVRPVQLKAATTLLREIEVHAGIICGDMNAILPEDQHIHKEAGLLDAWTGSDADEEGFTWGYQPPCEFAPGRLDKILYTSDERCRVERPRRVGVGLKTTEEQWATDHYGLVTTVRMIG